MGKTVDPRKRRAAREKEGKEGVPTIGESQNKYIERECRVPGAVVGWEHYNSSKKGTPGLLVRFVVLDGPDAGHITERTFWLTTAAMDQFLDFCLALGHDEPLDPTNDDHLESAFGKGAVMLDIKGDDPYTDKKGVERIRYQPAWFGAFKGKGKKSWNKLLIAAEKSWQSYIEWRKTNPRDEAGSDGDSGRKKNKKNKKKNKGRSGGGGGSAPDDEIPFAIFLAAGLSGYMAMMYGFAPLIA